MKKWTISFVLFISTMFLLQSCNSEKTDIYRSIELAYFHIEEGDAEGLKEFVYNQSQIPKLISGGSRGNRSDHQFLVKKSEITYMEWGDKSVQLLYPLHINRRDEEMNRTHNVIVAAKKVDGKWLLDARALLGPR